MKGLATSAIFFLELATVCKYVEPVAQSTTTTTNISSVDYDLVKTKEQQGMAIVSFM